MKNSTVSVHVAVMLTVLYFVKHCIANVKHWVYSMIRRR